MMLSCLEEEHFEQYARMRAENAVHIGDNDIEIDSMWGNQCLAYNVQISLPSSVQTRFARLQDEVSRLEGGNLLRCPAHALHISVASLVAVRAGDSVQMKETQWQAIRHESQRALCRIAGTTKAFQIRFCQVIATRGAIIAVATDDGYMQGIRERLRAYVPLRSKPIDIVHSTLFRYRARLDDPHGLLAKLHTQCLNQTFVVGDLQIRREKVYPSLDSDLVFAAKLLRAGALNRNQPPGGAPPEG